ncbi:hypothetical protein [Gelidibacter japonicus]|uniref:hypothetical protein n=1 Tax=Gelidibacter japonicus TaxID=1962232 RepID=UPI002AFED9C8|nr:hypothetical protein [Gelidibacter japonicus]
METSREATFRFSSTPQISYGLVSPHLENRQDFPKPVFINNGLCRDTPQLKIYINAYNPRYSKSIDFLGERLGRF